jgi:hypothetical protein
MLMIQVDSSSNGGGIFMGFWPDNPGADIPPLLDLDNPPPSPKFAEK